MTTSRTAFWGGVRAELPILFGVIPFGLIYGVLSIGAGVPPSVAQAMSAIIFAGSAQFVVMQLIGAGAPGLVIIATGAVINLRHALYSASVAPYLNHLSPVWKWLLAYLLTDEAYAVAITNYTRGGDLTHKHWFFLGAGVTLWSSWQISTAIGIFLGAQVPASWALEFTLPLTFIALVVPALTDRANVAAALTAGIASVLAVNLPFKLGLLAATAVGIIVGLVLDRRDRAPHAADQTQPNEPRLSNERGAIQ